MNADSTSLRPVVRKVSVIAIAFISFGLLAIALLISWKIATSVAFQRAYDPTNHLLKIVLQELSIDILLVGFASASLLLGGLSAWLAYRLGLSSISAHRVLGVCAVIHSVAILAMWFSFNYYRFRIFLPVWVAVAITWLMWPLLLIIHPQRSLSRVIVPVIISVGLLAPCIPKLDFLLSHFRGYPTKPNDPPFVEGGMSLGFGFSRVVLAQLSSFELGHFEYLFYRDRKLSQAEAAVIAPSGRSIVFQDGPSGNVFLFERKTGQSIQLTQQFPGLLEQMVWHEGEGYISAFVIPSAMADKSSGTWITLQLKQ